LNGKLIPALGAKIRYKIHSRTLQLYISLGLKIIKVHKILRFTEAPYLRDYIDFNTEKRKSTNSPMEKNMFKLMNNSICNL
jgi:hypothetical protein